MRILVVEDLPSGGQASCSLLRKFGHEIVGEFSFAEILNSFRMHSADAIIVDISNEESDGLEAFSSLQELIKNQCLLILSVHDDQKLAMDYIRQGAQDYLVKGLIGRQSLTRSLEYCVERNRVAVEQRLREERIKQVLEDSYDAFISMDSSLKITDWNSLAQSTFGWRREEVVGKSVSLITPRHLRKQFLRNIREYFVAQRGNFIKTSREIVAQNRVGNSFAAEFGVYKLEQDSECTYYGYLRDITNEKQTKESLEKLVEIRTEELTRSNSDLEQFAKIASHDLQEPLRAIEGFASLLEKG
ncbi:MAG: PAS domain S-box protein, partial [Cyanobacteria bacterium]|nr:PAS domain S-box protein [Cyanobacteriota bacterium]